MFCLKDNHSWSPRTHDIIAACQLSVSLRRCCLPGLVVPPGLGPVVALALFHRSSVSVTDRPPAWAPGAVCRAQTPISIGSPRSHCMCSRIPSQLWFRLRQQCHLVNVCVLSSQVLSISITSSSFSIVQLPTYTNVQCVYQVLANYIF